MTLKTLVVDNNPVLLKAVSRILEQEGCLVSLAENGLEALEITKKTHPDIIFTDLIMPLVGGEQLCKVVRGTEEIKDTFLVILSAIVHEERERILKEIDYDVCIAKGNLKDLRAHLREALSKYHKREQAPLTILGENDSAPEKKSGFANVARELLFEKHHLSKILENLSEGIIELSPHGQIVFINHASSKILNKTAEEIIGVNLTDLPWETNGEKIENWLQDEVVNKKGAVLEIPEDTPLHINKKILTAYFLPIQKDDSCFAVCILRDISRQFAAEKRKSELDSAIRLVKKMDAMSCMAGGVAHDFNNLLTVICGNLDMISLQDYKKNPEEISELVNNAKETAYATVELVRKISGFSPFGIIQREDIDIDEFVAEVTQEFSQDNEKSNLQFTGCKQLEHVNIDSQQIKIALENVLQNSLEAGGENTIKITVEKVQLEDPMIYSGQYVSAGNYMKIMVSDKGQGIEPENMLEIFDPYYSTKKRGALKGMGLGLTIVYSTLRNHGGYVVVNSKLGEGTDICLYLPIMKSIAALSIDDKQNQKQILLVEDDDQLRGISKIMLEYLGYMVFEARGKEDALKIFEENIDVSIAVLNLTGAGKQDGIDICRALKKIKVELQVIVSSGSLLDPVMKNCKEYGFSNTLQKPFTMDDLRNVLSTL